MILEKQTFYLMLATKLTASAYEPAMFRNGLGR